MARPYLPATLPQALLQHCGQLLPGQRGQQRVVKAGTVLDIGVAVVAGEVLQDVSQGHEQRVQAGVDQDSAAHGQQAVPQTPVAAAARRP